MCSQDSLGLIGYNFEPEYSSEELAVLDNLPSDRDVTGLDLEQWCECLRSFQVGNGPHKPLCFYYLRKFQYLVCHFLIILSTFCIAHGVLWISVGGESEKNSFHLFPVCLNS